MLTGLRTSLLVLASPTFNDTGAYVCVITRHAAVKKKKLTATVASEELKLFAFG